MRVRLFQPVSSQRRVSIASLALVGCAAASGPPVSAPPRTAEIPTQIIGPKGEGSAKELMEKGERALLAQRWREAADAFETLLAAEPPSSKFGEDALFGLATASDARTGHFAGVSDVPLAVSEARQAITASFSAEGFRAAAVTAVAMAPAGLPDQTAKLVDVRFDRPFGFLAVHRDTGLVLTAGWVTDPLPAPSHSGPGPGW